MKKFLAGIVPACGLFLLGFSLLVTAAQVAQAQRPTPKDQPPLGLIHRDLVPAFEGPCKNAFQVVGKARPKMRVQCSHGPDAAPALVDLTQSVPARADRASAPSVLCDGDGNSGMRVQVVYARASDVPDQYAAYRSSFQLWAIEADSIFNNSAAKTGASRHVRFVTDPSCMPTVQEAVLSPTGDDSFGNSNNELWYLGFNRTDRDYLIFLDAHVYCGISSVEYDDSPYPTNSNNFAPHYARVDAGCWSGVIAAHEMTHNFGGVQLSAPDSDGAWHCNDGYDDMCDHSGHLVQTVCTDPAGDALLDCNNDDYFNTNPAPNSYLAGHWNVANSAFLISPVSARVDALFTGTLNGKRFVKKDSFQPGSTVYIQIEVTDSHGTKLRNAGVALTLNQPNGVLQCTISATSDSNGIAQGACPLPRRAKAGAWDAHLTQLRAPNTIWDYANSVRDKSFIVK